MGTDELLAALARDLQDLRRYAASVDYDRFIRDRDSQNMVLFAVYRVVQDVIDLCDHIVSDRGLGIPGSYKEAVRLIAEGGLLTRELAPQLEGWVGLRNVVAHIYRKLDLDRIYRAMTEETEPLETFLELAEALLADT